MEIKTRYNIGDAVWVMMSNKAKNLRIEAITISVGKVTITEDGGFSISEYKTSYSVGCDNWYKECDIFPTEEELLKSL